MSISRPSVIGSVESREKKEIFCSAAVFGDLEVVLLESGDDLLGLFVADRGEQVHQIDLHANALLRRSEFWPLAGAQRSCGPKQRNRQGCDCHEEFETFRPHRIISMNLALPLRCAIAVQRMRAPEFTSLRSMRSVA